MANTTATPKPTPAQVAEVVAKCANASDPGHSQFDHVCYDCGRLFANPTCGPHEVANDPKHAACFQ